jgi:hypothetical protein
MFGVLALWWWRPTDPSVVASNPDVRSSVAVSGLTLPDPVKFDALSAVENAGADTARNPFAFGVPPAPPAAVPPPELSRPAAPLVPPEPPGPPPIPLRLTGITVSDSGRTVVTLRDPTSSALFQAVEGDVVDGRYRVVRVGAQSVVLSYLDGSGTRTVILGG